MMHAVILSLLILAWPQATEAAISGPEAVDVGRSIWLDVTGVTVAELSNGQINVFPQGSAQIRVLQDLRGTILLWAEFGKPGAYDVQVVAPYIDGDVAKLKSLVWRIQVGQGPNPPPEDPTDPPVTLKAAKATYIFEKDVTGAVPREVSAGLQKLNEDGIEATAIDADVTDGTGEVPDQYKKSIAAAREAGLPCLVVQSKSGEVVKIVPNPQTMDSVLESVK